MVNIDCSARGTVKKDCEKDNKCQIVHSTSKAGTPYMKCAPTAAAIPGFTHEPKWIESGEKGSLTAIFDKALGRTLGKGEVVNAMTPENCRKVGAWMAKNVSAWAGAGENPKTEGRMKIAVLGRPAVMASKRAKIDECAEIVGKALASLSETRRK